jgi:hypothetical protein
VSESGANGACSLSAASSREAAHDEEGIGGIRMRVLVANAPDVYQEVISATLKELRPHLEVFTAQPEDLDGEFARLLPQLVVCSRVTALVEREALAWIELYPGYASKSVVSLAGEKSTYPQMDFDIILSVVDEAQRLYETV